MKSIRKYPIMCIALMVFGLSFSVKAQSTEVQQLLLNVEKLSQLKNILADMKRGYQIVSNGYNSVKNIAQGNFSLHEMFLDGLMLVNPEIKKYKRVADIIKCQKHIIGEYTSAFSRFSRSDNFSVSELDYLEKVYKRIFDGSLDNLEELTLIITSSKLRMADEERLRAIDRIFADTQDKLLFLRDFNGEADLLNLQRKREKADLKTIQKQFNIN
ncbi:TerB family tellurite resistance protein [Pedobacter sp. Du54]|uniref:TerB family tellurite resistance protein n=1 Tax=Pedobacter anseongensis TaxID=3133439 RepID=UPI00309CAA7E